MGKLLVFFPSISLFTFKPSIELCKSAFFHTQFEVVIAQQKVFITLFSIDISKNLELVFSVNLSSRNINSVSIGSRQVLGKTPNFCQNTCNSFQSWIGTLALMFFLKILVISCLPELDNSQLRILNNCC